MANNSFKRESLKELFRNGKKPNQEDFEKIFDSFIHKLEDGIHFNEAGQVGIQTDQINADFAVRGGITFGDARDETPNGTIRIRDNEFQVKLKEKWLSFLQGSEKGGIIIPGSEEDAPEGTLRWTEEHLEVKSQGRWNRIAIYDPTQGTETNPFPNLMKAELQLDTTIDAEMGLDGSIQDFFSNLGEQHSRYEQILFSSINFTLPFRDFPFSYSKDKQIRVDHIQIEGEKLSAQTDQEEVLDIFFNTGFDGKDEFFPYGKPDHANKRLMKVFVNSFYRKISHFYPDKQSEKFSEIISFFRNGTRFFTINIVEKDFGVTDFVPAGGLGFLINFKEPQSQEKRAPGRIKLKKVAIYYDLIPSS